MNHIFSVCAYGECQYLETCIKSLVNQSAPCEVIICTSTPNEYIKSLANKYGLTVYINPVSRGIASDWNFAYNTAFEILEGDGLITLAHQDDIYSKHYAYYAQNAKMQYKDMSLFTSSCETIRNGKLSRFSKYDLIKKLLRAPLACKWFTGSELLKKLSISLGNPIICPACTYDAKLCYKKLFKEKYSFVLDWDALYRLAERKGRWICCEKPLMIYRVHSEAATAQLIENHVREKEESEMFDRLLPDDLSGIVKDLYKESYKAYK